MNRELNIVEVPARTVFVRAYCHCGGEVQEDGRVLTSHPAQYYGTCDSCNSVYVMAKRYPDVVFYPIDDVVPVEPAPGA
jgi:hypothetical protein